MLESGHVFHISGTNSGSSWGWEAEGDVGDGGSTNDIVRRTAVFNIYHSPKPMPLLDPVTTTLFPAQLNISLYYALLF